MLGFLNFNNDCPNGGSYNINCLEILKESYGKQVMLHSIQVQCST